MTSKKNLWMSFLYRHHFYICSTFILELWYRSHHDIYSFVTQQSLKRPYHYLEICITKNYWRLIAVTFLLTSKFYPNLCPVIGNKQTWGVCYYYFNWYEVFHFKFKLVRNHSYDLPQGTKRKPSGHTRVKLCSVLFI